ncbi:topoisomerase DNA-binding C4 zinc finger domain-containing protein, partial [Pelagibacterales bacterium SAG-MED18]|nr:topoisomerase DNA-binding C4 zinc finger domain-containing protein [Pelagibacterales bacterium SAG-MED18]
MGCSNYPECKFTRP